MINEYGPFNRFKALMHREQLQACADGDFMPPYWVATDPSNACNDDCIYCNARKYRHTTGPCMMTRDHLLRLSDFYKDWGVRAVIIEGGGEPLTNPATLDFIQRLQMYDIEIGLITNGSMMSEEYWPVLQHAARFVGISLDGADAKTYERIRGVNDFARVTANIRGLCHNRGALDVRAKMLITRENYKDIVEFAKLARDMGCSGAHIKPVAWEEVENVAEMDVSAHMDEIVELSLRAKEIACAGFDVDVVTYKYDQRFRKIVRFENCQCTPLGGVFAADGNFYLCFNMRGRDGFKLVSHYPDPYAVKRIWNTAHHKKLISQIRPAECMRCGLTQYNEIIENCISQDKMYVNFP